MFFIRCYDTPYVQGQRLYTAQCQNCHMEDGSGLENLIPQLADSDLEYINLVCTIKNGLNDTIYQGQDYIVREMPSFGHLSSTEVANIVNYITHKWKPDSKEITIIEIQDAINSCPQIEE